MDMECCWSTQDPRMAAYHDAWGKPVHDDRTLFEFLVLEGFQAGLSWSTILNKKDRFEEVFDGFDPERVAAFDEAKIASLLSDPGIVRNRLKIRAAVDNAARFLEVQQEFGTFDRYLWGFVQGRPVVHHLDTFADMPVTTDLSDRLSKDLRRRGFRFVGSTIVYSFLQAMGLVDDHLDACRCKSRT
jgi:DNA-3-methyladenine glycosylase I